MDFMIYLCENRTRKPVKITLSSREEDGENDDGDERNQGTL
jgi:hypothetical protein